MTETTATTTAEARFGDPAVLAFYGSCAGVANETHGKQVLPTWPR